MIGEPRIEISVERKLVGMRSRMSLSQNSTPELWHSFMKQRKDVKNALTSDLISMQVYDTGIEFKDFTPHTEFEKWATVEVSDFDDVPEGMDSYILAGGSYAVFLYKGAANDFATAFNFIFGDWLPNSIYNLDERPHFEVMGAKYKGNDPDSEEEIWIPIKDKQ